MADLAAQLVLSPGDPSTWNTAEWTFDQSTLQARPVASGAVTLPCQALKRQRTGPAPALDLAHNKSPRSSSASAQLCSAPVPFSSAALCGQLPEPGCFGPCDVDPGREEPTAAPDQQNLPCGIHGSAPHGAQDNGASHGVPDALPPDTVVMEPVDSSAKEPAAAMRCCVQDCGADLTHLRDFHQRYRICAQHIKAAQVLRNNRLERFCQQCSRFHPVREFEGLKRSCRKQLERHNARRRKRTDDKVLLAVKPDRRQSTATYSYCMPSVSGTVCMSSSAGDPQAATDVATTSLQPQSAVFSAATPGAMPQHTAPDTAPALTLPNRSGDAPSAPPKSPWIQDLMLDPGLAFQVRSLLQVGVHVSLSDAHKSVLERLQRQLHGAELEPSAPASLRISIKFFRCSPGDLPKTLAQQLCAWIGGGVRNFAGVIRPGCVFLTVQATVSQCHLQQLRSRGALSLLHHFMEGPTGLWWRRQVVVVQLEESLATYAPVSSMKVMPMSSIAHVCPCITHISSPVVLTDGSTHVDITLYGMRLASTGVNVHARCNHEQSLVQSTKRCPGQDAVVITVKPPMLRGAENFAPVWLEASYGAYMSRPQLVVFCTCVLLAKHLRDAAHVFCTPLQGPAWAVPGSAAQTQERQQRSCVESAVLAMLDLGPGLDSGNRSEGMDVGSNPVQTPKSLTQPWPQDAPHVMESLCDAAVCHPTSGPMMLAPGLSAEGSFCLPGAGMSSCNGIRGFGGQLGPHGLGAGGAADMHHLLPGLGPQGPAAAVGGDALVSPPLGFEPEHLDEHDNGSGRFGLDDLLDDSLGFLTTDCPH